MKLYGISDAEIDEINAEIRKQYNEARACMIASEPVLARDWNTPEEDAAWGEGFKRSVDEYRRGDLGE